MLRTIVLENFRNVARLALDSPAVGINLITGENGSGKTSVLEAIHLLGLGRSFRSKQHKHLIRAGESHYLLFSRDHLQVPLGMQFDLQRGLQIRLNNQPIQRLSELLHHLPIHYISANTHQFFELGPKFRRNLIDMALFHVEPQFQLHWRNYKKALQQRNACLKSRRPNKEIRVWDEALVQHGTEIDRQREQLLLRIFEPFQAWFQRLCPDLCDATLQLRYVSGWGVGVAGPSACLDLLSKQLDRDRVLGYTRTGPHAADWSVRLNGIEAVERLSRGQQKLFFIALSITLLEWIKQLAAVETVLLIDDLCAELDDQHQTLVMEALQSLSLQSFVTTPGRYLAGLLRPEQDRQWVLHQGGLGIVNGAFGVE